MSRRFPIPREMDAIDSHLADEHAEWGVTILWHRFDDTTELHDTYDVGSPRKWGPGVEVPAQFALVVEGSNNFGDRGLMVGSILVAAVSKSVLRDRLGWAEELNRGVAQQIFLKDRITYQDHTYSIDSLEPTGDVGGRDTMVSIQAREVREDETFLDEPENHDPLYDGG